MNRNFLLIFILSILAQSYTFACNFEALIVEIPEEVRGLAESKKNCSTKSTSVKACKCANRLDPFNVPRMEELSKARKIKYIDNSIEKAKISLLSIAQDFISLGSSSKSNALGDVAKSCRDTKKENKTEMHENHEHDANETAMHNAYQCPMDCEKGKTYDKEGTCPVCKMDLKKVEKQ